MVDVVKLTLDEIRKEPISIQSQVKVFLWAMILIPWSFLVHMFFTITGIFKIPGNVIDIVTLGEKTKAAIKRKSNANI
jgi:hypothetical protein